MLKCDDEEKFISFKIRSFLDVEKARAAAKPSSRPPSRPTFPTAPYRKVSSLSIPPVQQQSQTPFPSQPPVTSAPQPTFAPQSTFVPQQFVSAPQSTFALQQQSASPNPQISTAPSYVATPGPAAGPTYIPAPGVPSLVSAFAPSSYAKEIDNMEKLYRDGMKYSWINDNFAYKLSICHHFCSKADILYEARSKTFSSMLRGFAFEYYLANVNMLQHATFDQMCNFICSHFEKPNNARNNLIKRYQTTLKLVMTRQKNEEKSMIDRLNILVNDLRHLQHGLSPELQNELFMVLY